MLIYVTNKNMKSDKISLKEAIGVSSLRDPRIVNTSTIMTSAKKLRFRDPWPAAYDVIIPKSLARFWNKATVLHRLSSSWNYRYKAGRTNLSVSRDTYVQKKP